MTWKDSMKKLRDLVKLNISKPIPSKQLLNLDKLLKKIEYPSLDKDSEASDALKKYVAYVFQKLKVGSEKGEEKRLKRGKQVIALQGIHDYLDSDLEGPERLNILFKSVEEMLKAEPEQDIRINRGKGWYFWYSFFKGIKNPFDQRRSRSDTETLAIKLYQALKAMGATSSDKSSQDFGSYRQPSLQASQDSEKSELSEQDDNSENSMPKTTDKNPEPPQKKEIFVLPPEIQNTDYLPFFEKFSKMQANYDAQGDPLTHEFDDLVQRNWYTLREAAIHAKIFPNNQTQSQLIQMLSEKLGNPEKNSELGQLFSKFSEAFKNNGDAYAGEILYLGEAANDNHVKINAVEFWLFLVAINEQLQHQNPNFPEFTAWIESAFTHAPSKSGYVVNPLFLFAQLISTQVDNNLLSAANACFNTIKAQTSVLKV